MPGTVLKIKFDSPESTIFNIDWENGEQRFLITNTYLAAYALLNFDQISLYRYRTEREDQGPDSQKRKTVGIFTTAPEDDKGSRIEIQFDPSDNPIPAVTFYNMGHKKKWQMLCAGAYLEKNAEFLMEAIIAQQLMSQSGIILPGDPRMRPR